MKRLGAMQLWPELSQRASTAASAVNGTSQSLRTINGSLPPSSIVVFLSNAPPRAATWTPAFSLPVNAIARISGFVECGLKGGGATRDVGRVLEQHDVPRHHRGNGHANDLPEGEVPRHDGQDRPEWIIADVTAPD